MKTFIAAILAAFVAVSSAGSIGKASQEYAPYTVVGTFENVRRLLILRYHKIIVLKLIRPFYPNRTLRRDFILHKSGQPLKRSPPPTTWTSLRANSS